MKIFNNFSLKKKLVLGYVILFLFCAIGIYFGLYRNMIKNMKTQLENSLEIVTKQAAEQIDTIFSDMNTVSDIIRLNKKYSLLLNYQDKDYITQLSDYWKLNEELSTISAYFSNLDIEIFLSGKSLLSYENMIFYDNISIKYMPWYKETVDRKGLAYWTNKATYNTTFYSNIQAISNIKVMDQIYSSDADEEIKILKISVSQHTIRNILDGAIQNLPIQTYLIDQNGDVMISNSDNDGAENVYFTSVTADSGVLNTTINKKQMHIFYHRLKSNNWYVISAIPIDYYNNMLLSSQGLFWAGTTILFILFICVSFIMAGSINRRIDNINEILTNIERNNFEETLKVENKDELSRLEIRINKFIVEIQKLMKNIKIVEEAKRKSEISVLQAQIKPHFIYNTLDSINWMALDSGQLEISRAIVNLASFIRMSLHGANDIVSVKDELNHIRMYTAIVKTRSDCDIELVIDADERILNKAILKFILQPLVETPSPMAL